MKLRNHVEWALHCTAILAMLPEGKYISTRALAEFHGLPKEYLSKALQGLSQDGIVHTTLGPSGGYRLARSPEEITFRDIVEAVEGKSRMFICENIRANNPCRSADRCETKPCAIARVMWKADETWRKALEETRLSDVVATFTGDLTPEQHKSTEEWISRKVG